MYSDLAQEHIRNPRNLGPMEAATHEGTAGSPGEGPYMTLWFRVEGGVIRRAAFATNGCAAATAAVSISTVLLTGALSSASPALETGIRRSTMLRA